jgi:hypothetical protein
MLIKIIETAELDGIQEDPTMRVESKQTMTVLLKSQLRKGEGAVRDKTLGVIKPSNNPMNRKQKQGIHAELEQIILRIWMERIYLQIRNQCNEHSEETQEKEKQMKQGNHLVMKIIMK